MSHEPTPADPLKAMHTREAIAERLESRNSDSHLRDFIYGAIDGAVTTFAVVAGVEGAGLPAGIVIVLGAANLVADGVSMAVSNYLGTRAEEQLRERSRRMEEEHIEKFPEGEREEIRQIFAAKGFKGADLERAVKIITSDPQQWVNTMLTDELGMTLNAKSPWRAGAATFFAFVTVGVLPLLAFIYNLFVPDAINDPFLISTLLTAAAFFFVGALKSRFVDQKWHWAGLETLLVGGAAATCAYVVGLLLRGLVPEM